MIPNITSEQNITTEAILESLNLSMDNIPMVQRTEFIQKVRAIVDRCRTNMCALYNSCGNPLPEVSASEIRQLYINHVPFHEATSSLVDRLNQINDNIANRSINNIPVKSQSEDSFDFHSFALLQNKEQIVDGMIMLNVLSAPLRFIGNGIETVCEMDARVATKRSVAPNGADIEIFPHIGDVCSTMAKIGALVPHTLKEGMAEIQQKLEIQLEQVYDIPPAFTAHSFESFEILATAEITQSLGSRFLEGATRFKESLSATKTIRSRRGGLEIIQGTVEPHLPWSGSPPLTSEPRAIQINELGLPGVNKIDAKAWKEGANVTVAIVGLYAKMDNFGPFISKLKDYARFHGAKELEVRGELIINRRLAEVLPKLVEKRYNGTYTEASWVAYHHSFPGGSIPVSNITMRIPVE